MESQLKKYFDEVSVKLLNGREQTRVKCAVMVQKKGINLPEKCGVEMNCINNTMKRHLSVQHDVQIGEAKPLGPYKDRAAYLKDCVRLTVVADLPLSIWNDPSHQERENRLQSGFVVELSDELIESEMIKEHSDMMAGFGQTLRNTMFSITFDLSPLKGDNILGISVQYISGWEIFTHDIGMMTMPGGCTDAAAIFKQINNLMGELFVPRSNIYATTTDDDENVLIAAHKILDTIDRDLIKKEAVKVEQEEDDDKSEFQPIRVIENSLPPESANGLGVDKDEIGEEEGQRESFKKPKLEPEFYDEFDVATDTENVGIDNLNEIHCAAHVVNLGIMDFLTKYESPMKMITGEVTKIRKRFHDLFEKLPLASATCSTFKMMQSLLDVKDRLLVCAEYEIDWEFISSMAYALKPVDTLNTKLQANQYTAGDFKRDFTLMQFEFNSLRRHAKSITDQNLIDELENCLLQRARALDHPAILAALYLDPRFNNESNTVNSKRLTKEQLKIGHNHLCQLRNRMSRQKLLPFTKNSTKPHSPTSEEIFNSNCMFCTHCKQCKETGPDVGQTQFEERLRRLENRRRERGETNILEYWSSIEKNDPEIAAVAAVALAIPITKLSVENAFKEIHIMLNTYKRMAGRKLTFFQRLLMRLHEPKSVVY